MMKKWRIIIAVVIALTPTAGWGQSYENDEGEVSGYTGGIFGIGSHPLVGATSGLTFARYGMGLVDISYSPLGQTTLRSRPGTRIVQNSKLFDFNFNLQVRIPVGRQWVPYALFGPSILLDKFRQATVRSDRTAVFSTQNETNFGFRVGGGVRYHVSDNWGIRPEVRVVISNQNYVALSVGVFYTFPQ
jgi:opacity protein-like surface antigen